jgi:hypothetical protein
LDSPYINHFLSADTVVPGYSNPQNLNRYGYVLNNPLRYTDPTGHRCVEAGFEGSCSSVEDKTTKKWKADLEAARNRNKKKHDSPTPTAIIATLLDDAAAATNLVYAAVGDAIGLACAPCYLGVVDVYQVYSVIPNSISTLATGVWIADGVIKGENNLAISQTSQGANLSLSISQDTIVSVTTNTLGWTILREPNLATGVDLAVAAYDTAGLGIPGTNIKLPTFVNPTLTYNIGSGFGFSWHQK